MVNENDNKEKATIATKHSKTKYICTHPQPNNIKGENNQIKPDAL